MPTPGTYDAAGVFSGHIVADNGKAYMFYTGVADAQSPDLVTLHDSPAAKWAEVQGLAISTDGLKTWVKQSAPVIATPPLPAKTISGWRDPVVWRDSSTGSWSMITGAGIMHGGGGRVFQYTSKDLYHWSYVGVLAQGKTNGANTPDPVDSADMWECPDFFKIGNTNVLIYAVVRKIYWQTGRLSGTSFVANKPEQLLDNGLYYATRSQLDKDGNRILWGWIKEAPSRTDAGLRAAGWAGVMALPRQLTVASDQSLIIDPAPAVNALRGARQQIDLGNGGGSVPVAKATIAYMVFSQHRATGSCQCCYGQGQFVKS